MRSLTTNSIEQIHKIFKFEYRVYLKLVEGKREKRERKSNLPCDSTNLQFILIPRPNQ